MDKAVTRKRNKMKGEKRGRRVNPQALQQVNDLVASLPMRRDLLIEYLHLLHDKFGHISAAHITALASNKITASLRNDAGEYIDHIHGEHFKNTSEKIHLKDSAAPDCV